VASSLFSTSNAGEGVSAAGRQASDASGTNQRIEVIGYYCLRASFHSMPTKLEPRISSLERRAAQHDREIAAIRKLLLQGAKMLVRSEKRIERMEKSVDRFVQSLERGGRNGHSKTDLR
jgi:predicted  nucleic acid-binding Zn-ribbon protein